MTSPSCICIFTGYYAPHFGGVEKYTANLARHLVKRGYRVIVVTTNSENACDEEIVDGVKIIRLPVFKTFRERYPILNRHKKRYREFIRYLSNENIDYFILNTRFYSTTFLGLRLASKKSKRCFIIEHATGHLVTNNPLVNAGAEMYEHMLTGYIKKRKPAFYGVSNACTRWLNHFNITASGVFYNGIDPVVLDPGNRHFRDDYKIPPDHLVISAASRLIPEKGVLEVTSAFEKIAALFETSHFFLAGDGPLLNVLSEKYADHPRIHILGRLEYTDILTLFDETDIVINPSRYPEGLPTVILEAGMAKCAVIATDKGGSPEIIPGRDHGVILSCYEAGCFTQAIQELCENAALRTTMAINLETRVKEYFNWERIVDHFILTLNSQESH